MLSKQFLFLYFSLIISSTNYATQNDLIQKEAFSTKAYCAFCDEDVLNRQKFYEDDLIYALYTHKPILPGHCLIIPKRHVERFEILNDIELTHIGQCIKKVNQAVEKVFKTSTYLLLQKNGKEVGQTVPHVHFHYIPRLEGDDSTLKFLFKMYMANIQNPLSTDEMQNIVTKMKIAMDAIEVEEITKNNNEKFKAIRSLNLPLGQYAITGSGPLGIRNLRQINDIDIIVDSALWNSLEEKYGSTEDKGIKKITFPGGIVEAFRYWVDLSHIDENKQPLSPENQDHAPTVDSRILNAEIIDGLPFESLEMVLYYKRKMGREKDKKDIKLIEKYLNIADN